MPENIEEKIIENALGPKSMDVDGQRIEQHSPKDLIELDRYLSSKKAVRSRRGGLRIAKMVHGGAE
jgi:hypothetical protein